ncbi:MAG: 50S ribosomal protein L31 [Dehalococcoidia bacterium]
MKAEIHPTYYPNAQVQCVCGNSWTVGSTRKELRVEVCAQCHPFWTGEQRIVDTEGRVERMMRRYGLGQNKS